MKKAVCKNCHEEPVAYPKKGLCENCYKRNYYRRHYGRRDVNATMTAEERLKIKRLPNGERMRMCWNPWCKKWFVYTKKGRDQGYRYHNQTCKCRWVMSEAGEAFRISQRVNVSLSRYQ